jgi:hypothetical protein
MTVSSEQPAPASRPVLTKGERREERRWKRKHGMQVDGAQIRRVQLALIERQKKRDEDGQRQ